jgi:serine/threonine protein kinase
VVAIKKMKTDEEYAMFQQGVPAQVIREVACLRDLIHPNVVELLDVHIGGVNDYSLIFEYVEGDLHKLLKSLRNSERKLGIELVRKYALELLTGIHACHVRLILHRDLKPQNILIGPNGLKIGDFGLSRMFSLPIRNYSLDVITLWYRAPEILLGCQRYGAEVDMWSAGCIISEMATMFALFNGDSEIGTMFKIFKLCGTPSEATWPGLSALEHWKTNFPIWPSTNFKDIADSCPELGEDGMDLIRNLLVLAPGDRFNARRAKALASECMRPAI